MEEQQSWMEVELKKDMVLDGVELHRGSMVYALKVNDKYFKVFHHTGWWKVPAEYFE